MVLKDENPVTFEELARLCIDRTRLTAQRDAALADLQKLNTQVDKAKRDIALKSDEVAVVESKIKALGKALGEK